MPIRKNPLLTLPTVALFFFFCSSIHPKVQAEDYKPYLQIKSEHHSPALPIQQLRNDLKGPAIESGDYAFSTSYAEIGLKINSLSIAALTRIDLYTAFTNDTAKMIHADKNKIAQEQNRSFNIHLYGFHLKASGVKATYQFKWKNTFHIDAALSYLDASAMYQGVVNGRMSTSDDDISGSLSLDYSYNKDVFFSRAASDIHGNGYSGDLKASWQVKQKTIITFSAQDLYSQIDWNQQLHTVGTATTDTIRYDSSGLIHVRPAIEWLEDEKSLTQKLPQQFELSVKHTLNNQWQVEAQVYRYDDIHFHRVGAHYQLQPEHRLSSFIDIDTRSLSLGYAAKYGFFSVTSDHFDWNRAHSLGLNVAIQWCI